MFTGIITDIGCVRSVEGDGDARILLETHYDVSDIVIGASITCSGVCLTVVDKGQSDGQDWFAIDVSQETLRRTSLLNWEPGRKVNLERALRLGDELGGHIVSGHVDGVGQIKKVQAVGDSLVVTISVSEELKRFVAPKGSVAVDGVSLTVNEVYNCDFRVNIIPHTRTETTLGQLESGDQVNVEIDMLARYVARLNEVKDE